MPVTYTIDADQKTIRTRCTGHLTLVEVIEHFRALEQDPACPARPNVYLDLTEVESLPATQQLSTVVSAIQRIQERVRFQACAILVTRDALFGMMRMFEAMAQSYFRVTRTFRTANEAEAWLRSQPAPAGRRSDRTG